MARVYQLKKQMAVQREELQTNQRPRNCHANFPSSDSSSSSSSGFKSDETSSEEDVSSEEVEHRSNSKEVPEIYSKEPALYKGESRIEPDDWREAVVNIPSWQDPEHADTTTRINCSTQYHTLKTI